MSHDGNAPHGPGTELKAMLAEIGINPSSNCSCNANARRMDELGVDGCREHFNEFVQVVRENAERWGWQKPTSNRAEHFAGSQDKQMTLAEKLAVGWRSVMSGVAFKVNWLDPYPGLIEEAIRRADAKKTQDPEAQETSL